MNCFFLKQFFTGPNLQKQDASKLLQTKTYIFADLIEGKKTQTSGGDAVPPL